MHPFKLKQNVHKGIGNYLPHADVMDLAASIQQVAEEFVTDYVAQAVQHTGIKTLCIREELHSTVWPIPNCLISATMCG